jgi:hypothetical protein
VSAAARLFRFTGAALASAAVCLGATGCWNAIPLGHLALFQILAVDPAKDGNLRWTLFQANATALANMGSGVATPSGGTTSDQVLPVQVVAPTLAEAYRKAQDLSSRDIYLGQLQQVVVSERLNAGQVRSTIDALAHTPELDQSQALFVAPGDAADTILARDPQELFPSTYLDHVTACPTCNTTAIHVSLMDAFMATRPAWGSMVVPEVTKSSVGLAVKGAAVYEGARFIGRVAPADETLLGLLTGMTQKTSLDVKVPGLGAVSVRGLTSTASVSARWRHGAVEADDVSRVTGQVVAIEPDRGLAFEHVAPAIDSAVSRALVRRAGSVVAKLMAKGGDPLQLGREVWAADPSAAPSAAVWRRGLLNARIRLTVHTGLTSQGTVR